MRSARVSKTLDYFFYQNILTDNFNMLIVIIVMKHINFVKTGINTD